MIKRALNELFVQESSKSGASGTSKFYEVLAYMPDHVQEIYYSLPSFNASPPARSHTTLSDGSNPQEGKSVVFYMVPISPNF